MSFGTPNDWEISWRFKSLLNFQYKPPILEQPDVDSSIFNRKTWCNSYLTAWFMREELSQMRQDGFEILILASG